MIESTNPSKCPDMSFDESQILQHWVQNRLRSNVAFIRNAINTYITSKTSTNRPHSYEVDLITTGVKYPIVTWDFAKVTSHRSSDVSVCDLEEFYSRNVTSPPGSSHKIHKSWHAASGNAPYFFVVACFPGSGGLTNSLSWRFKMPKTVLELLTNV